MKSQLSKLLLAVGVVSALAASASYAAVTPLGDARFAPIHPGLTRDEVRSILGAPARTDNYKRLNETQWAYPFMDTWGYQSEFDIEFDDNGVVTAAFAERTQD